MAEDEGLWFKGISLDYAKEMIGLVLSKTGPRTFAQAARIVNSNGEFSRDKTFRLLQYLGIRFNSPKKFRIWDIEEEENTIFYTRSVIKTSPMCVFERFRQDCLMRGRMLNTVRELLRTGSTKAEVLKKCRNEYGLPVEYIKVIDLEIPSSFTEISQEEYFL